MGLAEDQDGETCLSSDAAANIDAYTSTVSVPGSIKFVSYTLAPSFFGVYYGFAPSAKGGAKVGHD